MADNVIEFPAHQPQSPSAPRDARLQELLDLEHEVFELRHTISVLAVELVGYRAKYG